MAHPIQKILRNTPVTGRRGGRRFVLLKVYMTELFYFLNQIFMLLSCENRRQILINISSPRLRRISVKFTSSWVKYRARQETGDSRAFTSMQER